MSDASSVTRCGRGGAATGWPSPGVPGDPTDGHVDAEAGGGALFFGLAAPEAVLAVLACPVAALDERRARAADGAGLRLAHGAGLGPLAGGSEEQPRLARGRRPRRSTCSGPVKMRFATVSAAMRPSPLGDRCRDDRSGREPVGGNRLPELVAVPYQVNPITRLSVKGLMRYDRSAIAI